MNIYILALTTNVILNLELWNEKIRSPLLTLLGVLAVSDFLWTKTNKQKNPSHFKWDLGMIKLGINHNLYSGGVVLLGRFNFRKHEPTNFHDMWTETKLLSIISTRFFKKKCVQSFYHTMWANTINGNKRSLHAATQKGLLKSPPREYYTQITGRWLGKWKPTYSSMCKDILPFLFHIKNKRVLPQVLLAASQLSKGPDPSPGQECSHKALSKGLRCIFLR